MASEIKCEKMEEEGREEKLLMEMWSAEDWDREREWNDIDTSQKNVKEKRTKRDGYTKQMTKGSVRILT